MHIKDRDVYFPNQTCPIIVNVNADSLYTRTLINIAERISTLIFSAYFISKKWGRAMKYGVALTIVRIGYVEVEVDCEEEAKAIAEELCQIIEFGITKLAKSK